MTDPFLSDFLAPGVDADEVPELAALASARPLLDAFITLFRGTEAEVLMRLLVLREIGREADVPRWSPDALRARFTYLDPVKLETVLKRLRDNALLAIGEDGHYALSDIGRNAVAAIAMLLRFGEEEDAELGFLTAQLAGLQAVGSLTPEALGHLLSKLNDLTWHFEEAIASGSEFRILDARRRLSANGRWLERGTDILNSLLADPEVDFDIARIAQRIGLAQSRLARVDAAFQRALNKIESQRVTLGASGISSSDVAAWLRSLDAVALAGLALEAFAAVPEIPLLAGDLVERWSAASPLLLALEIPAGEHAAIRDAVVSGGSDAAIEALRARPWWRVAVRFPLHPRQGRPQFTFGAVGEGDDGVHLLAGPDGAAEVVPLGEVFPSVLGGFLLGAVGMFVGWPDMAKVCLAILIAGGLVSVAWALWTSRWQTVLKNLQTGVMQHLRSGLLPQIGQPLITQVSPERVPYALAVGLGTAAYYAVPL